MTYYPNVVVRAARRAAKRIVNDVVQRIVTMHSGLRMLHTTDSHRHFYIPPKRSATPPPLDLGMAPPRRERFPCRSKVLQKAMEMGWPYNTIDIPADKPCTPSALRRPRPPPTPTFTTQPFRPRTTPRPTRPRPAIARFRDEVVLRERDANQILMRDATRVDLHGNRPRWDASHNNRDGLFSPAKIIPTN